MGLRARNRGVAVIVRVLRNVVFDRLLAKHGVGFVEMREHYSIIEPLQMIFSYNAALSVPAAHAIFR